MVSEDPQRSDGSQTCSHNQYQQLPITQLPQIVQTTAYIGVIVLPLLSIGLVLTAPQTLFELVTLAVLLLTNIVTIVVEQLLRNG